MALNLHPIFVHFPIAFLTIYGILELFQFSALRKNTNVQFVKGFLVTAGVLTAFLALQTGEMIERDFSGAKNIIEIHSAFATFTTWLFVIPALAYLTLLFSKFDFYKKKKGYFLKVLEFYKNVVLHPATLFMIGLVGIFSIGITGTLGGIIAYGKNVDPFTKIVYNLFFG